jgi:hypothetical protein
MPLADVHREGAVKTLAFAKRNMDVDGGHKQKMASLFMRFFKGCWPFYCK